MKILYAIQGTGNGHISRARAILPELARHGDVDILISGMQVDVQLDADVKYRFQGLGFIFGKGGGVDLMATYRKNKLKRFKKEVKSLPVGNYDLVISDFEPVSAWACMRQGKVCIGLSHQSAVLHKSAPQPEHRDRVGTAFLNYYAPATHHYGFHFKAYAEGIFTPVIRDGVRHATPRNRGHYTVYLPAYSDKRICGMLRHFPATRWEVFSKHATKVKETENAIIRPIHDTHFLGSMAAAAGVVCGAGFETPAEALFLKKKLIVVPMKNQYEQHCNAAALRKMGVPVLKSLKPKHMATVESWLQQDAPVAVDYPDQTAEIVDALIAGFRAGEVKATAGPPAGKFKRSVFQTLVSAYINA